VRHLRIGDRFVYGMAGFFLLLPVGAFAEARWFNIVGGLMTAVLFVWERARRKAAEPEAAETIPAAVAPAAPSPANPTDRALLDRMGVRGTGEGE
jgi:hypothetical protein